MCVCVCVQDDDCFTESDRDSEKANTSFGRIILHELNERSLFNKKVCELAKGFEKLYTIMIDSQIFTFNIMITEIHRTRSR